MVMAVIVVLIVVVVPVVAVLLLRCWCRITPPQGFEEFLEEVRQQKDALPSDYLSVCSFTQSCKPHI